MGREELARLHPELILTFSSTLKFCSFKSLRKIITLFIYGFLSYIGVF